MKNKYEVRIIDRRGNEVSIYGPTENIKAVRKIADKNIKRRKVKIYKDNKLLPRGIADLDKIIYEEWLEENQP
jgi:hypothetical protein